MLTFIYIFLVALVAANTLLAPNAVSNTSLTLGYAAMASKSTSLTPEPTPGTIIDILSSQPQYSYFLRHLQLNKLIPFINSLENVTLLAPVNSAFADGRLDGDLLKYFINQKVRVGWLPNEELVYETLYKIENSNYKSNYTISIAPDFESMEFIIDSTSLIVDCDNYAKNQYSFVQGIDKFLPLKPTLCQVLLNKNSTVINGKEITFMKLLFQSLFNDEYNFINDKKYDKESTQSCDKFLQQTLLIPTDDCIRAGFSPLHQQYYLALFDVLSETDFRSTTKKAKDEFIEDIRSLLDSIQLPRLVLGVNGTDHHDTFNVTLVNHTVNINDISSVGNIVLSNGVIHTFDDGRFFTNLNLPVVKLVPRKVLNALHFTRFSKELVFRNLGYLIDGSTSHQSLFLDLNSRDDFQDEALMDDIMSLNSATSDEPLSEISINAFSAKQSILYQFGDAINITKRLQDNDKVYELIQTRLCSNRKIGGCFDLKVASTRNNDEIASTLNDELEIIDGPIDFGDNSFLYIVDGDINTPSSLKHALGDIMSSGSVPRHTEHFAVDKQSCLTTLEYLNKFKLTSLRDNSKGYSIFLPCGINLKNLKKNNWNELGLIYKYLQMNPKVFAKVMKGMIIEDIIYTNDVEPQESYNANGDLIKIESGKNYVQLNSTKLDIPVNSDILFNQGVIHLIDQVVLPEYFEVPIIELLKTTIDLGYPHHSILDLIDRFPKLKQALGLEGKVSKPFSLLVPAPDSLKDHNITANYINLLEFLEFHLIPNDQLESVLACVGEYDIQNTTAIRTNLTGTALSCYQSKSGHRYLKLVEPENFRTMSYNKDREVKIMNYGCTNVWRDDKSNLQCVILIEKPLNLQWLKPKDVKLHLGFISLGIGVIFGLTITAFAIFFIVLCVGRNDKHLNKATLDDNRVEPHFMRVRMENEETQVHDRGYDTDIDVLRDNDEFLPLYGTKKIYKKRDYGSIRSESAKQDSLNNKTTPVNIKVNSNNIARDRNLPDV